MKLIGDQFHLQWHAAYEDTIILCDQTDLQKIEDAILDINASLENFDTLAFQALDLTPYVIFNEDFVEVRLVTFSKWGGVFESIYTLGRYGIFSQTNYHGINLIPYDCGIEY